MTLANLNTPTSMNDMVEAMEDSDVASIRSVRSFSGSAVSTLVNPIMLAAADEVVEFVLAGRSSIAAFPYCSWSYTCQKKLESQLKKLLEQYALELEVEAKESLEREACRLIKSRGRYIAGRVLLRFDETERDKYAGAVDLFRFPFLGFE